MMLLGRRSQTLVALLVAAMLASACAKRTDGTSALSAEGLFTSDGSQGIDLSASSRCFVQDAGVDGCGIGGTEKTREALGYALLRLKDSIAKIRLGAGHTLLCRAPGQTTDSERTKYCRQFALDQVEKFYRLTHHDTFSFEPRRNLPGNAMFIVYLKAEENHAVYYDQDAVEALLAKDDLYTIERGLGHELGHLISLPTSLAPIGFLRDNDSVPKYTGVQNAGALLLSDIGTGFARVGQDNGGYASLVLSSKPEVFLRLRETGGTVAADSSGKNHPGQLSGNFKLAQSGPLRDDSLALELNGARLQLNIPQIERPETTAVTLEFWMWASPSANQSVASFSVSRLAFFNGFFGFHSYMDDLLGTARTDLAQKWVHVVSVWQRHLAQNTLYLNGVRQNVQPLYSAAPLNASMPDHRLFFGNSPYVPVTTQFPDFSGRLAEIAVYLRPLSAAEAYRNFVLGQNDLEAAPLYGTPDVSQYVEGAPVVDPQDRDLVPQYLLYSPTNSSLMTTQLMDIPAIWEPSWRNAGTVFSLRSTAAVGAVMFYRCLESNYFLYGTTCETGSTSYIRPMGYAYQAPAPGRVPIYACGNNGKNQMLVTSSGDCAVFNLPSRGIIGYGLPGTNWDRQSVANRP